MSSSEPRHLAEVIHRAHRSKATLDANDALPLPTADLAYAVQRELTALRHAEGWARIGYKLGYTSEAMRRQMGVSTPNFGPLFTHMMVPSGSTVSQFVQPRVEPEIAVILADDLAGTDLGIGEVAAAVARVHASLEIVDSIWTGYRFSYEQNTADGSSAAGVVVGAELPVAPQDCDSIGVRITVDGAVVGEATGAAAGGHPLLGVAWLCEQLAQSEGSGLRAGDLVITGGLTSAFALEPGTTVEALFNEDITVAVTRAPR